MQLSFRTLAQKAISASNPQRLSLNGRVADIQTIINYLQHDGEIEDPIVGSDRENWSSAPTLNGVMLTSFLNHVDIQLNSSMIFIVIGNSLIGDKPESTVDRSIDIVCLF